MGHADNNSNSERKTSTESRMVQGRRGKHPHKCITPRGPTLQWMKKTESKNLRRWRRPSVAWVSSGAGVQRFVPNSDSGTPAWSVGCRFVSLFATVKEPFGDPLTKAKQSHLTASNILKTLFGKSEIANPIRTSTMSSNNGGSSSGSVSEGSEASDFPLAYEVYKDKGKKVSEKFWMVDYGIKPWNNFDPKKLTKLIVRDLLQNRPISEWENRKSGVPKPKPKTSKKKGAKQSNQSKRKWEEEEELPDVCCFAFTSGGIEKTKCSCMHRLALKMHQDVDPLGLPGATNCWCKLLEPWVETVMNVAKKPKSFNLLCEVLEMANSHNMSRPCYVQSLPLCQYVESYIDTTEILLAM